ncbi:MAG: biotin/lipoyl-binding protein [Acidobacteria bacterium]|nr:MAG: biotin/lipoyl-binding protein [Acidobacteriota bacterium]
MATELKLPNLGENVHSGNVVRLLVAEGDVIAEQQPILEIETDKAAIEVPSPTAGKVAKILVKEGQTVNVGDPVISVEAEGGGKTEAAKEPPKTASGPAVKPPPAKAEKPAAKPEAQEETEPRKETPEQERRDRVMPAERPAAPPSSVQGNGKRVLVPAAPSVRRFAREIGVDIGAVAGTGPSGRISVGDVKAAARSGKAAGPQPAAAPSAPIAAPPLPDLSRWGEIHREQFTSVRRATARQMTTAWSTIPHVTQFDKADITELEVVRKQYSAKVEKAGGKLTVTAVLLKVVASALKVFPKFNASLDMEKGEIVFKHYFHVGVAVDTPKGLLVPVIRDVDQKNVVQLSAELASISDKTRNGKLTLEEMQGGSFTVSNLGGIGGTGFAPIVNLPEVAILGVARASLEPVFREGSFQPRMMLPLSLSYDHRLIDGADGARFLRWVCEALEEPFLLMLEG